MTAPGSGWLRYVRASIVASIAVTVSVTGHMVGGGHRPHPLALLVLVALAMIPAYVLGSRRLTRTALIALLAAAQLTIHLALSGTAPSNAHHHDATAGQLATAAPASPAWMVIGHALATVALSLLLATGESLLWRLWLWLSACWPRLPRLLPRSMRAARPWSVWFGRPRTSNWLGRQAAPRGPPWRLGLAAG